MILELKKSFVKDAEKIFNRFINGYYVDLQSTVDRIYYLNSITFCAPSATILCGDSSTLCGDPTLPATISPACSFATAVARYIWEPTPGTTLPPVVFYCNFNGGYAEKTENNCLFNGGYALASFPSTTPTPTNTPTSTPTSTPTVTPTFLVDCVFNGGDAQEIQLL